MCVFEYRWTSKNDRKRINRYLYTHYTLQSVLSDFELLPRGDFFSQRDAMAIMIMFNFDPEILSYYRVSP